MLHLPKFTKPLAFILSVITLSLSLGYFIFAWTEPNTAPPGGNVSTPINVSTDSQGKAGILEVTELKDYNDNTYFIDPSAAVSAKLSGDVQIGGNVNVRGNLTYRENLRSVYDLDLDDATTNNDLIIMKKLAIGDASSIDVFGNTIPILRADLNFNGVGADAGDLVLMKQKTAQIRSYDLNLDNYITVADLDAMKTLSVGNTATDVFGNTIPILRADLNFNGVGADAGDLVLMKREVSGIMYDLDLDGAVTIDDMDIMKRMSVGEIVYDTHGDIISSIRADLNGNGVGADAGDLVLMKQKTITDERYGLLRLSPMSVPSTDCDGTVTGILYYDSDINRVCYCDGTSYKRIDTNAICS